MATTNVWEDLISGNALFASGKPNFIQESNAEVSRREKLATEGQQPRVAVLTCADSRVSPELIFNKNLGELFVIRVAGNVATSEAIGSLEYAVMALKTEAIVVLGHSKCGAVTGAMDCKDSAKKETALDRLLGDIAGVVGTCNSVEEGINKNTTHSARQLETDSTIIKDAVDKGTLKIISAVYDLHSGKVQQV